MVDETGIQRRPLLKAWRSSPVPRRLGVAAAAPARRFADQGPDTTGHICFTTGWDPEHNGGKPVRLMREDGTPIRPEDVSVGGQMTVFPGIPGGATNKYADSPDAADPPARGRTPQLRENRQGPQGDQRRASQWQNFVAYSKICTHAGCPASLYEQQTNRLLCPCHQSQFQITDNARPIFGPASRALAAAADRGGRGRLLRGDVGLQEPVGPAFWERP